MFARLCSIGVVLCVIAAGVSASGQDVVVYRPIAEPVLVAPGAVGYGPVVVRRPVAVQRPVFVAPAPVTVYRPVVPQTVYSPIQTAPVVVGRPIIVRPKVYVRGQPIRNVLRAVTP